MSHDEVMDAADEGTANTRAFATRLIADNASDSGSADEEHKTVRGVCASTGSRTGIVLDIAQMPVRIWQPKGCIH